MALTCAAGGCSSNESTKIEGKIITFFPFPEDDNRREKWTKNSRIPDISNVGGPLYLCELHFDKVSFTTPQELKPDAVPTIFDKVQDDNRKRTADGTFQSESRESPPIKQKKLREESNTIITPPQSPTPQITINDNNTADSSNAKSKDSNKGGTCRVLGKVSDVKSESYHETKLKKPKKVYRLTIQIDKICGKPCPRTKKVLVSAELKSSKEDCVKRLENNIQPSQLPTKTERKVTCIKGGCKLKKAVYNSKPAYQCEYCDKFYVTRQNIQQEKKSNACSLCDKSFPSSQSLFAHIRCHFICDMCQTECMSQVSYDKHLRLHVSTDPLYTYKCHVCRDLFQLKEDMRQHYLVVHPTVKLQNTMSQGASPIKSPSTTQPREFRCTSCNITFRNEQGYRNHVSSHKQKEDLRRNLGEPKSLLPVGNPLTGSQIGILRAVKFSCRVCSMEFDNVRDVDRHTRTHLGGADEEQKCNICRKVFRSSLQFAEHLKYHLSRAHPCPMCPKAFINRASLKNHFKTHGKVFAV